MGDLEWAVATLQVDTVEQGVRLSTDAPVAGVWLRSATEGRFEDNGFSSCPVDRARCGFWIRQVSPPTPGTSAWSTSEQGQTSAL